MDSSNEWLDTQDVADELGISVRTVFRRVEQGDLTPVHRGNMKKYYFARDEVLALKQVAATRPQETDNDL